MSTQRQRCDGTKAEYSTPDARMPVGSLRQPIGDPIRYFVTRARTSRTGQFSVIRRSTGIESHTSESYYRSYEVAAPCINRCASWICHNRLSRQKLHENLLRMISTEFSSLATHNTGHSRSTRTFIRRCHCFVLTGTWFLGLVRALQGKLYLVCRADQ
jgi:hypothetical protein